MQKRDHDSHKKHDTKNKDIVCYKCQKSGHFARDCYSKSRIHKANMAQTAKNTNEINDKNIHVA